MYTNPDDDFFSLDHKFFGDSEHDPFDDDFFKKAHEEHAKHFIHHGLKTMEWVAIFFSVFGFVVFLIIMCKCCARRRNDGHVINPPPPPGTVTTAPYPQQQYATVVTYPVAPYVTGTGAYPQSGMQVVTATAYPSSYPTVTAYPATAAPYPSGPSSYPHPQPGPYPSGSYPHPQPQPGAAVMPQPYAAPSAPDSNALPPSYDQATGAGYNKNSTPYNPSYGNV